MGQILEKVDSQSTVNLVELVATPISLVMEHIIIFPLVPLLYIINTKDATLLPHAGEGTIDGQGESVMSLFHAKEGLRVAVQLTRESDWSTRYHGLVYEDQRRLMK